MCGIAGAWGGAAPERLGEVVDRMAASQHHRGPDDRRVVMVPAGGSPLVLGFDRLAILDPSERGAQPMHHPETDSWLVFNGEIYDFRALRRRLEGRGHRFRSSGDAEVLLAALVEWGEQAMTHLRGMWAFAFYDGRRRRLLLGRDPFGIKPLLYGRVGDTVVFASELRAILDAGLGRLRLDRDAMASYLGWGAVAEPATMAQEIRQLPAGHVAWIDADGGLETPRPIVCLSDFAAAPEPDSGCRLRDAVGTVGSALRDSVQAHLVSDVPVGVLLSSGVDSGLVAALVDELGGPPPSFLTVGFSDARGLDDARFSEVAEAGAAAVHLRGRHHVVSLGADEVLGLLPDALAAMDQPTADGVNTFVVARAAAGLGLKVLLSGLGGDELFGGYTSFVKAPLLAAYARLLGPMGRGLATLGLGNRGQWSKVAGAGGVRDLRDAYLLQRALVADAPLDTMRERLALPAHTSPFRQVSWLELSFYLRNQLLHDADVMASASSVEVRVPFLDVAVLRQAWALPPACHLGWLGERKRVLRALLGGLRGGRVERRKRGFVFPWVRWLRGALGEGVAATLADRVRLEELGLPGDAGRRALDAFRTGDPAVGWAVPWSLFVLLEWQRRHPLET